MTDPTPPASLAVRFWGVRGSIPVSRPEMMRYGGSTACVELRVPGGPPLVIDCGTGARALGIDLIQRREPEIHVLFSHFHMDHLFGFPFFGPLYSPNSKVRVAVPAYSEADAQNKLGRYLNGIYHPVRVRDLSATLAFEGVRARRPFELGPYRIHPLRLEHPGGALGYRVQAGGRSVVYLSDTAPFSSPDRGFSGGGEPCAFERRVLDAIEQADLVIMDTMFSWEEYIEKMTWGHAYPEYAYKLCQRAGVRQLALFHHAPDATDTALDALAARWADPAEGPQVLVAQEGARVDLEG